MSRRRHGSLILTQPTLSARLLSVLVEAPGGLTAASLAASVRRSTMDVKRALMVLQGRRRVDRREDGRWVVRVPEPAPVPEQRRGSE